MGVRAFFFLVVWLAPCSAIFSDESGLEVEDVISLITQNARIPQNLRVAWRIHRRDTKARLAYHKYHADALGQALKDGEIPEEEMDRVRSDIKDAEARAKGGSDEFAFFDYWTDFSSFQNRAKRTESGGPFGFSKPSSAKFADLLPNFTELTEVFDDTLVLSYGPETGYTFRVWQASTRKPYKGIVETESPWFSEMHPPLVMPPPEWGGQLHPVDDFLKLLEMRGEVVANVELNGEEHLLVFATDGERSMRVFLAVEKGYVPSRIETFLWELEPALYRKHVISNDDSKLTANFLMECTIDTTECSGGLYHYPSKGTISEIAYSPSPKYAISPLQQQVAVHKETLWEYELIECDREMAAEDFRLTFPPKMVYIDQSRGGTYMTSDIEGNMKQVANAAIRFGQSESNWLKWVGITLAILVALVAGLIFYRKRRIA